MGLHYFHGGADPEDLETLADSASIDYDLPEEIEEITDAAEANGYVIKGLLLADTPDG